MTRIDAETRTYLRREIDRRRRIEIEGLRDAGPRWTHASVLDSIRTFEAMTGRPPARPDFDDGRSSLPSSRTVGRIFGSVGRAVEAAFPIVEVEIQATLFEVA